MSTDKRKAKQGRPEPTPAPRRKSKAKSDESPVGNAPWITTPGSGEYDTETLYLRLSSPAKALVDADNSIGESLLSALKGVGETIDSSDTQSRVGLSGKLIQPTITLSKVDQAVHDGLSIGFGRVNEMVASLTGTPVHLPFTSTVPSVFVPPSKLPVPLPMPSDAEPSVASSSEGEPTGLRVVESGRGTTPPTGSMASPGLVSASGGSLTQDCVSGGDYALGTVVCPGQIQGCRPDGVWIGDPNTPDWLRQISPPWTFPGLMGQGESVPLPSDPRITGSQPINGKTPYALPGPGLVPTYIDAYICQGTPQGYTAYIPEGWEAIRVSALKGLTPFNDWVALPPITNPVVEPPPPLPPPLPNPCPPCPTPPKPSTGECCCGKDEDHPCWTVFAKPQADSDGLKQVPGWAKAIDKKSQPPRIDVKGVEPKPKAEFGVIDNANNVIDCTIPYQIALVGEKVPFSNIFWTTDDSADLISRIVSQANPGDSWIVTAMVAPQVYITTLFMTLYFRIINGFMQAFGRWGEKFTEIFENTFFFNFVNSISFGAFSKAKQIADYHNNLEKPISLPTSAEAGVAWLGGTIDDCTFEAYVRSNDNVFEPYKRVVSAGKYKLSPLELTTLARRGKLGRGDLKSRLREMGSLESTDVQELMALFEQVPGASDIVRFMVRDADDEDLVKKFDLDAEFTDKYQTTLRQWGEWQGIPEKLARYYWRSHWSIPSPTQLYEMYHRLRHRQGFGGPAKVLDDVTTALKQQDILPYWIPSLLAVAFRPLTRIDSRKAYNEGIIDDETYKGFMYDNGYSDEDAETLLRFAKIERDKSLRSLEIVKEYRRGFISKEQLSEYIQKLGYSSDLVPKVLEEADTWRVLTEQESVVKALVSQYKKCRISRTEFREIANSRAIPAEVVEYQLDLAELQRKCIEKHETIGNLCTLLDESLITPAEYLERAKDLGWDRDRADEFLTLCQNARKRALAKEEIRKAKEAEAEQAKADRKAQQDAARAERQAQRAAAALERIRRARESRNVILERASATLAGKLKIATGDASVVVESTYNLIINTLGATQNEAANAVAYAASKYDPELGQSFPEAALGVATAAIEVSGTRPVTG